MLSIDNDAKMIKLLYKSLNIKSCSAVCFSIDKYESVEKAHYDKPNRFTGALAFLAQTFYFLHFNIPSQGTIRKCEPNDNLSSLTHILKAKSQILGFISYQFEFGYR